MNLRSIKFKLVAWYASLLTVIFLLLCALLYLDLRNFLESNLRDTQARRVRQLGERLLVDVKTKGEPYVVSQIKDWYAPESTARFIRVTRADGTLVYVSGTPNDGAFDPAEIAVLALTPETGTMRKQKLSGGNTMVIASLNFKSAEQPITLLNLARCWIQVEAMLNRLFMQLALGLPLAGASSPAGGGCWCAALCSRWSKSPGPRNKSPSTISANVCRWPTPAMNLKNFPSRSTA